MTSRFTPLHFFKLTLFLFLAIGSQFSAAAYQQNLPFNIAINGGIEIDPSIKKARQLATRFVSVVFKLIDVNQKHIFDFDLNVNALSKVQKYLYENEHNIVHYVKKSLSDWDFLAKNTKDECYLNSSLKRLVEQINDIVAPLGFREFFIAEELYDDAAVTLGLIENSIIKLENFYKKYKDNPTWKDTIANYFNGSFFATVMLPRLASMAVSLSITALVINYFSNEKKEIAQSGYAAYKTLHDTKKGSVTTKRRRLVYESLPSDFANDKISREVEIDAYCKYKSYKRQLEESFFSYLVEEGLTKAAPFGGVATMFTGLIEQSLLQFQDRRRQIRLKEEDRKRAISKVIQGSRLDGKGVCFDDIVGYEDIKQLFYVLIDNLSNPLRYHRQGISIPQGVLLYGPAGVGKTMFMKALASEANRLSIPCIAINANQLVSCAEYTSKEIIDAIYEVAGQGKRGFIIFIDEIDGVINPKGSKTRSEVETNLLMAWDGIRKGKINPAAPIMTIVATNTIDRFRNEFIRSGRMDIKVPLGFPDKAMWQEFLKRSLFKNDKPEASSSQSTMTGQKKECSSIPANPDNDFILSNVIESAQSYPDANALINLAKLIAEYEGASYLDDPKYILIAKKFIKVSEE